MGVIDIINRIAGNDPTYPQPVSGQTADETVSNMDDMRINPHALADQKINWSEHASNRESVPQPTERELLESIRNESEMLLDRYRERNNDFSRLVSLSVPVGGTTIRIEGVRELQYLYVPPNNGGDTYVFLGEGTSQWFGAKFNIFGGNFWFPRTDVITLLLADNTVSPGNPYDFCAWLSTRPVRVKTYTEAAKP